MTLRTKKEGKTAAGQWQVAWAAAALAIVGALVWGRTAGFGFVWDDDYFIVRNPAIRSWTFLPAYFSDVATMAAHARQEGFLVFRPIRNISYLVDFTAVGLAPAWWHLHNVLLHIGNALLLMLIARRLLKRTDAAVVAAALFLLHPVQTEAVAWVKCRDDLLACLFVLSATYLWLRRRARLRIRDVAALSLLYLLACLSKIQAIALPGMLLAFEVWVPPEDKPADRTATDGGTRAGRMRVRALVTLGIVGTACLAWRHAVMGATRQTDYLAGSLAATMLTMSRAAVRYMELLLWPRRLLADYSGMDASTSLLDGRVPVALTVLGLSAAALLWLRRRAPLITFGIVWIGISLAPMSNLVPMMQYMAERFLYLPMGGFALAAGSLFARVTQTATARTRYRRVCLVTGMVLAALTARTLFRLDVWRNPGTLFAATARDAPGAAIRPRRNLLKHLVATGQMERALPLARELWATQGRDPDQPARARAELARCLGLILVRTGSPKEGHRLIAAAATIDPSFATAHVDRGVLCGEQGDHEQALAWFRKAIATDPAAPMAYYNMGLALDQLGHAAEAEAAFRQAIRLHTSSPEPHRSLAALLWRQGRIPAAVNVYTEALKLWPEDADFKTWHTRGRQRTENARRQAAPGL